MVLWRVTDGAMEREREIADRVLRWFSGETAPPYECRLSPTNKCNLACLPCVSRGRPAYEQNKELTKNDYIRIVNEAAELGVQRFDVCGGGEPFCRQDTIFVIEKIKEHGLEGTVSTNGTVMTKDVIRRLVDAAWDEIRFSINGPDVNTDDYLRGLKGAFELSIRNIKRIVSLKKELNKEKPYIILTPIITSLNHNKIVEFVELSHNLGVGSLILQPFMPEILPDFTGKNKKTRESISNELKLNDAHRKKFQSSLKEAKRLAEEYGINTNFESLTEKSIKYNTAQIIQMDSQEHKDKILSVPCYQPWWVLDISVDGSVGPCPRAEIRENVREKKLSEIWNCNYFNSVRKMLGNGKIPSICKSCCAISTFDNQTLRSTLSAILSKRNQK